MGPHHTARFAFRTSRSGPSEFLEVELTEPATMEHPQEARRMIEHLSRLEVSFAIDDFGTGDATLSNLSLVKARKLKIDASSRGMGLTWTPATGPG